ncbi:hypothetical protein U1Q18_046015, partial [Sarracenia purpurea var. burkii]
RRGTNGDPSFSVQPTISGDISGVKKTNQQRDLFQKIKGTAANLFTNPKSQRPSEEEDHGLVLGEALSCGGLLTLILVTLGGSSAKALQEVATTVEKTRTRRFQIPSRWRFQEAAVVITIASLAKKHHKFVRDKATSKARGAENGGERETGGAVFGAWNCLGFTRKFD